MILFECLCTVNLHFNYYQAQIIYSKTHHAKLELIVAFIII